MSKPKVNAPGNPLPVLPQDDFRLHLVEFDRKHGGIDSKRDSIVTTAAIFSVSECRGCWCGFVREVGSSLEDEELEEVAAGSDGDSNDGKMVFEEDYNDEDSGSSKEVCIGYPFTSISVTDDISVNTASAPKQHKIQYNASISTRNAQGIHESYIVGTAFPKDIFSLGPPPVSMATASAQPFIFSASRPISPEGSYVVKEFADGGEGDARVGIGTGTGNGGRKNAYKGITAEEIQKHAQWFVSFKKRGTVKSGDMDKVLKTNP